MGLWLVVVFILCSASGILYLTFGPLKTASNVMVIRSIAALQYLCAVVLVAARLLGKA